MSKASEWAKRSAAIQERIDALEEERGELAFKLVTVEPDGKGGGVTAFARRAVGVAVIAMLMAGA
jgi:hypothetical protein